MSVSDIIDRILRSPPQLHPFRLRSRVEAPATTREITEAWGDRALPGDAMNVWKMCREARLYEDVDDGQWGLVLMSPGASAEMTAFQHSFRPEDMRPDDVVLGEFLGDLDLLVLAPSERGSRKVMISLELDARSFWFGVGSNLEAFLERYFDAAGDKFWEPYRHLESAE